MRLHEFEAAINPSQRELFRTWRRKNSKKIYQIKRTFSDSKLNESQQLDFESAVIEQYLKKYKIKTV